MSKSADIRTSLEAFGLSDSEASVYLHLVANGPASALELSRETGVSRTSIYRTLQQLRDTGLVSPLPTQPSRFAATSGRRLETLLDSQEGRLQSLRAQLPGLLGQLTSLAGAPKDSTVGYYEGVDGLATITERSLRTKSALRLFEKADMDAFLDHDAAEQIRRELALRRITTHQLTNAERLPAWTNVAAAAGPLWLIRHLPPTTFPIEFEILIYDDTVALYNYGAETFGIEIESRPLARMQRQLFDLVWASHSAPMRKIGKRGGAVLVVAVTQAFNPRKW